MRSQVQIVNIVPPGYRHAGVYDEVITSLRHAFIALGHDCRATVNHISDSALNVVLAAQLLPPGIALPPNTVILNLDPLTDGSLDRAPHLRSLFRAHEVWDYSPRNLVRLQEFTRRAFLLRLGTMPQLQRIVPAAVQDIDVLFYGSVSPRRRVILEALGATGMNVVSAHSVYGGERDALIARAKVVLNLHWEDGGRPFEMARVAYLLANGKAVVGEVAAGTEIEDDIRPAILGVPYDSLVEACRTLVADTGRRSRLEAAGLAAMAARPQDRLLAEVLAARTAAPEVGDPRTLIPQGVRLAQQGRSDMAIALLRQAATAAPALPEAHLNLGVALMQAGRPAEAEAALRQAESLAPRHPAVAKNLGMLLLASGPAGEAARALKKAVTLEGDGPDAAALLNNLGVAQRRLGRLDEAIRSFRRAGHADPGLADACKNLALTLTETRRTDEALEVLDKGLARAPQAAELHAGRAHALKERGQVAEAMAAIDQACTLDPDSLELLTRRLLLAQYQDGVDAGGLRRVHGDMERRHGARLRPEWRCTTTVAPPTGRPLRVGYVSGDLRRHPVGFFMAAVLPHHDHAQVVPVVYNCHPHHDELTAVIRNGTAEWHQVHDIGDAALADLIHSHRIDILVDLAGHTAHNRLPAFARKPAPVQATWAGYVGTTGLAAMDWLIADRVHVRPGEEAHYGERIARMPDGYIAWSPPAVAPAVAPLPALARGHVTLGGFHNIAKLGPSVVATWAEILHRLPTARLLLRTKALGDAGVRRRYQDLFAAHGIAAGRLTLAGELPQDKLMAAYGELDIALDTFPYSGGVTTLEAMWMGVPVVTFPGDSFAGRHATSHLGTAGHPELVAADRDDYVRRVVALAGDLPALAALRARLRPDLAASPTLDHAAFTRNLEQLYRRLWRAG